MEDAVEPARLRSVREDVVGRLPWPQLLVNPLLFHVVLQLCMQLPLKFSQVLLRETARSDEIVEVLMHKHLDLRDLFL